MALASRLQAHLQECRARLSDWEPIYDALVEHLRSQGVASSAPAMGDRLAAFALPDLRGGVRTLGDLLAGGPIVLSFIRGTWCPYCREEIAAWRRSREALASAGGRLVHVTAEIDGEKMPRDRRDDDGAEMLLDRDHGLALAFGLAFWGGTELQRHYLASGLDLSETYGNASGLLSVPATFVVDRDSIVRFAFADPDFRVRAEPSDVIEIVAHLC